MNLAFITLIALTAPSAMNEGLQASSSGSPSIQSATVRRVIQELVIEDSSWRKPIQAIGGVTEDRAYLRQLIPLLDTITPESVRTVEYGRAASITRTGVGNLAWEDLVSVWPLNSPEAKDKLIADSGASADISVQPRLTIYDTAGKLVDELNLGRSLDAQKQLVPVLKSLQPAAPPRCPDVLRRGMKAGTWDIPKGRSSRSLRSIVESIRTNSRLNLTVDDRIADLIVTTTSEGLSIKWSELVERLPGLLDLSWRKVDDAYHLTAADGGPISKDPGSFDSLVVDVLTRLQKVGVIDATVSASQIVGAESDLGTASESVTNAIAAAYSECGQDAGKFRQVLQAARQTRGYRMAYEFAISSVYNGPGFSFTTFVNSR